MPYIPKAARNTIKSDNEGRTLSAGEFNYIITQCCIGHLEDHGLKYDTLNEIVGALECAKLELWRRVGVPYENRKMVENGDVYPPQIVNL